MYIPFIDRDYELKWVLEWFDKGFYPIMVIYGPEGCGKTRLLIESINRVREFNEYMVFYIDALEDKDPSRAFYGSSYVLDTVSSIIGSVSGLGSGFARAIGYWFKKLVTRINVRGRHVVLLVDDVVRAIGLDNIDVYCKKMLDLLEEIYRYDPETVSIIVTTSEGLSRERLLKHRWTTQYLLWNLDRDATRALLEKLHAPRDRFEEIIEYTGGNPRSVIELWRLSWNTSFWFKKYLEVVRSVLETMDRELISYLEYVIEDPDYLSKTPSSLYNMLLEYNIVIELPLKELRIANKPVKDLDLGIGERYAFQLPIYRYVLKKLVDEN